MTQFYRTFFVRMNPMNIHQIIPYIENHTTLYKMLKYCPYEILKQWKSKNSQVVPLSIPKEKYIIA